MTSRLPEIDVYDTTLRDGAQQEGISFSVEDKLAVAALLDSFGVAFIEGGWPGANPRDTVFFERAARELRLQRAMLVAFGSTRRPEGRAATDPMTRALLDAETPVVTVVAKAHLTHVERALRCAPRENLAMIEDTVAHLVRMGRRVFLDAEHFFDGYRHSPTYARAVLDRAAAAGAEAVVLCDTNGGMLPDQIGEIVAAVAASGPGVGIHCHDDSGCAVANSLAAIAAGATQVQGTINGYGERTGNADLVTVVGNLHLKLGRRTSVDLPAAMATAAAVGQLAGEPPHPRKPYVGRSAFTHKAGLHASAVRVDPALYQHVDPAETGNATRTLISDMAGRSSVALKIRELGLDVAGDDDTAHERIVAAVKAAELRGYSFEGADASFAMLVRGAVGSGPGASPFRLTAWRQSESSAIGEVTVDATVSTDGPRRGRGLARCPVQAAHGALLEALAPTHPQALRVGLRSASSQDVRTEDGTRVRVTVALGDGAGEWAAVGVGDTQAAAALEALCDGIAYGLLERTRAAAGAAA